MKDVIKKTILKGFKALITRCYGGDLECNSIRNLMKNGDEIFGETSTYLYEQNNHNLIGNSNDVMSNEETKKSESIFLS